MSKSFKWNNRGESLVEVLISLLVLLLAFMVISMGQMIVLRNNRELGVGGVGLEVDKVLVRSEKYGEVYLDVEVYKSGTVYGYVESID